MAIKGETYYRDACEAWSPTRKLLLALEYCHWKWTKYGKIQFYFGEKVIRFPNAIGVSIRKLKIINDASEAQDKVTAQDDNIH